MTDIVGRIVQTQHGLGKIVSHDRAAAVVAFYHTLASTVEHRLPQSSLRWTKLSKQSRCFVRHANDRGWQFGRIGEHDPTSGEYEVHLPDARSVWIHERAIYVRSGRAQEDPTDTLVAFGHETAFFFGFRHELNEQLLRQRRATRGLTGLVSSRIVLWPHQVEVVRRVLEDPTQRYLLADEVGLGKTIEAGIILRQCLLDKPGAHALVLVPRTLVQQWEAELDHRCDVFTLGSKVDIVALEDFPEGIPKVSFDMVIIDEAHQVASWLNQGTEGHEKFLYMAALTHAAERLLLLSATPAMRREQQFLGMLHLIDPRVYRLDDLAGFQAQLALRREVGRLLFGLEPEAMYFALREKINDARRLFPRDDHLHGLCDLVMNAIAGQVGSHARAATVEALFVHISETYRLHRRLLRSRRVLHDGTHPYEWRSENSIEVIYDDSEEARQADADFEVWRDLLSGALPAEVDDGEEPTTIDDAAALCWHVAQLLDGAPSLLAQAMTLRCAESPGPLKETDLDAELMALLARVPRTRGEQTAAQALQSSALRLAASIVSIDQIAIAIRTRLQGVGVARPPRCVVFARYTSTARHLAEGLASRFGQKCVGQHFASMRAQARGESLAAFRESWDTHILVCDQSAEEGLNLECADYVVHVDLPWNPNQLEQRIGRLDRISRKSSFSTVVVRRVNDPASLQQVWLEVLRDGLGVFAGSIAGLQYFVQDRMPVIQRAALRHGAPLLRAELVLLRDAVIAERERLEQDAIIDAFDLRGEESLSLQRGLDAADDAWRSLQAGVEGWLVTALQCDRDAGLPLPRTVKYDVGKRTLLPFEQIGARFRTELSRTMTYDREVAAKHDGVALCRLGDPLLTGVNRQLNTDDRGRAFAIWRHLTTWNPEQGSEWIGFRFDIVVEADLSAAYSTLSCGDSTTSRHAIERRADALFEPKMETVFIGVDGVVEEDTTLLQSLARPFSKSRYAEGMDYNLTKDRVPVIEDLVPLSRWESTCHGARDAALAAVRSLPSQEHHRQLSETTARNRLDTRLQQLTLRKAAANDNALRAMIEEEITGERAIGEALIEGVRRPRMRIDALGLIVLSGRAPTRVKDWDLFAADGGNA